MADVNLLAALVGAVHASLLTTASACYEIVVLCGESNDLIVIGMQGRGSADLLFFGSTTQHVVRGATCPVLTLRHL